MRLQANFLSVAAALLAVAVSTEAATISLRATKKESMWNCENRSKPDAVREGLTIELLIDGAPEPAKVILQAKYNDGGTAKEAPVPHSAKTLWKLDVKDARPVKDSPLTVEGTIDGVKVACEAKIEFAEQTATPKTATTLPAMSRFTKLDAQADTWLQSAAGIGAAKMLVDRIYAEQRIKPENIVLLIHLPSGTTAFPFPASVSEHQVMQIATVVNMRDVASVEVVFTTCNQPLRERLKGNFGALAVKPFTVDPLEPEFALKPIGSLFQCGPENMGYSMTVATEGTTEKPAPAPARLEVRPVYHLGATAVIGFDMAKKPTFAVKSGVVTKQEDRFGTSLFVGATWYPFGVDYGRMRWYNYVFNPFGAVSLENPKENFVVGNAFTVTGGISLAIGLAFHHLDELDGIAEGASFTGDGNVPTIKRWSKKGRGVFIGVAVDNNVFTALKKIKAPAASGAAK